MPASLEILNINEYVPAAGFLVRGRKTNVFEQNYPAAAELARLTNLTVLRMAQCGLEGDVPDAVLQTSSLDLRGNTGLTGKPLLLWLVMEHWQPSTRVIDASYQNLTGERLVSSGLSGLLRD